MPLINVLKHREGLNRARERKSRRPSQLQTGARALIPSEVEEIELRSYQASGVRSSARNLEREGSVVRTLATGGGKTEEAIAIAKTYKRVIFISPTEMLSIQSSERFRKAGIPSIAVTKDDRWWKPGMKWPEGFQAVMCTEGTAHSRWVDFEPDLIIFDEAHHVYHPTYPEHASIKLEDYASEWLDAYKRTYRSTQQERRVALNVVRKKYKVSQSASIALVARYKGIHIYGMTGTLWRLRDTEGFQGIWKAHVLGPGLPDLVDRNHLVGLKTEIMAGKIIADGIGKAKGAEDYTNMQLAAYHRLNEARFTQEAVDWLLERSQHYGKPILKTICYAMNQKHALALAEYARGKGIRVGLLLSSKELLESFDKQYTEQVRTLERFKNDELDMLINVAIAIEGFDCPAAEAVLITRVTQSLALYLQMVGRATRKSEGKDVGYIFDATRNSAFHGTAMIKREWSLEPRGQSSVGEMPLTVCINEAKCGAYIHPAMHSCPECKSMQGSKCIKCFAWSRRLPDDEKCRRCLIGESALKRRKEQEQRQLENYVDWNHRNFRFQPSTQKPNSWDCVIEADKKEVKMRITKKPQARNRWRGIWWDPKAREFYEPEDWAERTIVGNDLQDVRQRLIQIVSDEYGESAKVRLV